MSEEATVPVAEVLEIIAFVRARYPADLFDGIGPPDSYSAAGARLACDNIERLLLTDKEERTV